MSALQTFTAFKQSLSPQDSAILEPLIRQRAEDILAARSEEARLRLVTEFIQEAKERSLKS